MIRSVITQLNKEIPKPQGWRNTTCLAELVSASKEPEIPKQVRNDKKSEMRGAAHVDKQPGEFLRANRCYLQGSDILFFHTIILPSFCYFL